jgi:uncharacterized protein
MLTRLVGGTATAVLGIGVLLIVVWLAQRRLIYFPLGGDLPDPWLAGLDTAENVTLLTEDGLRLGAWYVEPPPTASVAWTLILFNGNAGNRAMRAPLARKLVGRGVSVLLLDYRGYGGNPGTPSEGGLLHDARAARRWVDARAAGRRHRVAYLGESLGSGVAVSLAAEREPDALVLRSPFTSLADVGTHHYPFLPVRLLLRDRYASIDRIGRLTCPVLIVAAERDSIVPVVLSRRLFQAAEPSRRRWVMLEGADHNDLEAVAGDTLADAVVSFLGQAER